MSTLWPVIKYEIQRSVLMKSFLFTLLSVPVLVLGVVVSSFVGRVLQDEHPVAVGIVDHGGTLSEPFLRTGDDCDPPVSLLPFSTEEVALEALNTEEITAFYVLPPDVVQTRRAELVYREKPGDDVTRAFQDALRAQLLISQPPEIARRVIGGSQVTVQLAEDGREFSGDLSLGAFLPALGGFVLMILIFVSSGYLMQAISEEKTSRTMEILLTSISANQLMMGKVLGILATTFVLLVGCGLTVVPIALAGDQILSLEWLQNLDVDPKAVLIVLPLLISSYVLVAALLVTIGAALADARVGQQITSMLILLYLMPVLFIPHLLSHPRGALTIGLSLFPLTAPILLPLRIAFAHVPIWQIAASLVLQGACAVGGIWLAGRTVRLGMLRYGRAVTWRELVSRVKEASGPPHTDRPGRTLPLYEVDRRTDGCRVRNKTWLVLRYELITSITRPSFLLLCVGLPLFVFGQMVLFQATMPEGDSPMGMPGAASDIPEAAEVAVVGYVDRSGLIQVIPGNIPLGTLVGYTGEASARQALDAGEISSYYVIPAEYVETGELVAIRAAYNPFSADVSSGWMDWLLIVNLLGGDVELAAQVRNPVALQRTILAPEVASTEEIPQANPFLAAEGNIFLQALPTLIMLLVYGVVILASGLLISSVSDEKKNHTMEVMLLSIAPRQMLAGKITALAIASLVQAVVWGGIGYLLFASTEWTSQLPPGAEIPPSILFWGIVYSLLGYAIYATLMAGAGALIPDLKKSPLVVTLFAVPAFIGFQISLQSMETPHSALSTAASLFPLTAPFSMINRLVVGGVPLWQVLVSIALMLITIPLLMRVIARMFHAQNLLTGQPFTIGRYLQALRGR
jgi:ABC-2 type transport system permease protein